MKIYKINTNGVYSLKGQTKEFYKMLIGGVVFYLIMFFAIKFSIGSKGYSLFLIIFLTALYLYVFIYIPITLMIRINKVVRSIQFEGDKILFSTSRCYIYNWNDIIIKEVHNRFSGFSYRRKSGMLTKTKEGKEFWIIEDFYNDYEELKLKLIAPKIEDKKKENKFSFN